MSNIIIETDRLILREMSINDFNSLHEIFSDEDIMKYYPEPFVPDKTLDWIAWCIDDYKKHNHSLWSVILKSENKLIGDCGILRQYIKEKQENEISYHLNKKYWHNGFATEAAFACKKMGFNTFKYRKLVSVIDVRNKNSINVAERIGFSILDVTSVFGWKHFIYGEIA